LISIEADSKEFKFTNFMLSSLIELFVLLLCVWSWMLVYFGWHFRRNSQRRSFARRTMGNNLAPKGCVHCAQGCGLFFTGP
jgi:uncharacterized membrane protein